MSQTACDYCGCDVTAHDPVYVEELVDGTRTQTGAFCTYGCLAAHIEHEGLATGTTCRVEFE
ncbi:hypothetical protein GL213_02170 [Halogeometricum borinquense]|uniref:MYM-type domain-containing protein n=1 Tax=Halogeometricum borinquense TaxID=60847 RepID=A0A6C0UKE3_9EURY|nr:hypothetical protein [Halogeometricum borinquense]QIB75976.1 hypothetical protein G3I44_17840 [Halogeometricum borinquense]QIQ75442.1 hypothetical protein GL213_02170 [Halogeometricum borinquense]